MDCKNILDFLPFYSYSSSSFCCLSEVQTQFWMCLFFSLLTFFLDLSSYCRQSSHSIHLLLWTAVLPCCSRWLFLGKKCTIMVNRNRACKLIALGCITLLSLIPHLPPHPSSVGEEVTIVTEEERRSRCWAGRRLFLFCQWQPPPTNTNQFVLVV